MGISIHYQGRLGPGIKPREVWIYASLISKEKGWSITDMAETDGAAALEQPDGEDILYTGTLHTFALELHEHCEPLIFQFTQDGCFRNWCKTQFAPLEIHTGVIDFFRQMKKKFSELVIQDEGGFWESNDSEALEDNRLKCFRKIQNTKEEDQEYYGPVKSENGRIIDLMK